LSKSACILFVFCAATAITSPAQVLTTLHNFDGADGIFPQGTLVQATDGNFYGTTFNGGASGNCNLGCGTVFKISRDGALTTLHSFDGNGGANPVAGLVQASDGNFYGTTEYGGANDDPRCNYGDLFGCGTVFKVTPGGNVTTLYNFCSQPYCSDGYGPLGVLVQARDGNFYGMTSAGGIGAERTHCGQGCGTVFKITPDGTLTTLHSFDFNDGYAPFAGLVQASDGNLYGTTLGGGANAAGTVLKITPAGTLTTLHSFRGADGLEPWESLVQASDGNLYGTTVLGGSSGNCVDGCGTVFKITPDGVLTTLHSFDNNDGTYAIGGLVQASDGNFYGTTFYGGAIHTCVGGCGTAFKITPGGMLTTLHTFINTTDGANPYGGLVQATDGNLYGTTQYGGARGDGTVFRLVTLRACAVCPSVK
jgi:uncharacterized repeat protein (TIGR03803 family)